MSLSLTLTMLLLAAVASPHCASMCGCGLAQRWLSAGSGDRMRFQAGRVVSGTLLGALAGGASQTSAYWMQQGVQLFAVAHWVLLAVVGFMGVVLIVQARPVQIEAGSAMLWAGRQPVSLGRGSGRQAVRPLSASMRSLLAGFSWMALPCGVIYSAVALAYLSGSAAQGAWLMFVFASASAVSLAASGGILKVLRKRWSEGVVARLQGMLILLGLGLLAVQKLGWVQTPQALNAIGFCL